MHMHYLSVLKINWVIQTKVKKHATKNSYTETISFTSKHAQGP